jgi:two-component system, cell cycle sensor histidine kinase and response regulator CckA
MRILYVEDNRQDVDLARIELDRACDRPQITVASSLTEAWKQLETPGAFDVVVVDLSLPDGSGIDLVVGVREKGLPLAIIMLTGSGDERSAVAALKAGVDDYLVKRGDYLQQLPQVIESAVASFREGLARTNRPLRVLYAEHHKPDIELARRHLERHAAHMCIEAVHTAPEALARLKENAAGYDVMLLDYRLVGMNALEFIQLLKQEGQLTIPVVLVTGQGDEIVAVEALRLGASDYLVKRPGYLHELASTLENAFHRAMLARERAALRASEASGRLREEALEAIPLGVLLTDAHRKIIYVNPGFMQLTGYSMAESIGRDCGFLQGPGTDDVMRADIREAIKAQRSFDGELLNYRKDGTAFWNHLKITPVLGEGGELVNFIGVQQDVTMRRRIAEDLQASEERFRQIAENIQEVFWMTDPVRHTMLYISPAYETIWGRRCEDIIKNPSDWTKAIHPDDRARASAAAKRQLKGNYDEVYRVVRPDGSIRWVRDKAFPIRNEQGEVYRIVGTAEDITEHRKLEEQFLQSQKMEAIGTLAGGIAHDFNNILAAITGYTELIKMQVAGNPQLELYIESLLQAGSRATSLVRQILAFSRQSGHERCALQLDEIVAESLDLLRATIPATISFDIELAPGLPPVLADATQIHQVMMNLGTNAAQAMAGRAGKLGVTLSRCEVTEAMASEGSRLHAGPYLRLMVSDTGKGMSREVMDRMFEPFFTTKGPGEGTGLGLAVVHGVMQSHDGDVVVRSEPGAGTVFELYFPVHAKDGEMAAPEAAGELKRGKGERVLFVDDEVPIMLVGKLMLEEIGYTVEGLIDAKEAIECLRKNPQAFDVVVTDLTMPNLTGLDFARLVHEIRPDIPIILTTGYNATLTIDKIHALGLREMLLKPLSLHSLGAALRRVLDEPTPIST